MTDDTDHIAEFVDDAIVELALRIGKLIHSRHIAERRFAELEHEIAVLVDERWYAYLPEEVKYPTP